MLRTPLLGNFISKPSTVWILYKYHTVGHYNRSANSENESQEMKTEDATGNPILDHFLARFFSEINKDMLLIFET